MRIHHEILHVLLITRFAEISLPCTLLFFQGEKKSVEKGSVLLMRMYLLYDITDHLDHLWYKSQESMCDHSLIS